MSIETKKEIILQKNQVFDQVFQVELIESCRIGNGIVQLSQLEKELLVNTFDSSQFDVSYFIPASGTGSRMFKFLFEWMNDKKSSSEILSFFENMNELPFYQRLVDEGVIKSQNNQCILF